MQKLFAAIAVFFICMFVVFFWWKMRKDFPFDIEVVPGDKSAMVINTNPWTQRDCLVLLKGAGISKSEKFVLSAGAKSLVIDNLVNERQYKLTIKRSDFLGQLRYRSLELSVVPQRIKKYVVFVGASIGKAWDLRKFAERQKINIFVGYRGCFEFDKTSLIESVIKAENKPDMVIIKECAAYFPRDTKQALVDMDRWVKMLINAGVQSVLATVVPVTNDLARETPGRMQSINDFNNGLRSYGKINNIEIIDMQSILADKKTNEEFLDKKYADHDGLHLKPNAYNDLDEYLLKILTADKFK